MAVSDVLALTVPALLAGVGLYGALTGTDVFSALTAGAPCRMERVAKYNQLLRIEDWIGLPATYENPFIFIKKG